MSVVAPGRLSTGVTGLDVILCGGLVPNRSYLVRGKAGTGKTTLGFHYLTAEDTNTRKNLFITFGESTEKLKRNAEAIGISVENIEFLDLSPTSEFFAQLKTYDIFLSSEVEREPITKKITETLDSLSPDRVFIDSMTQLYYLAKDGFDFRRYILSFLRYLMDQDTTILFTSEESISMPDDDLQFISDGVIQLDMLPTKRTVSIIKFRASPFIGDAHTMRLNENGMEVFPRLIEPETALRSFELQPVSSGIAELDNMLHGGLERGTVTLITGPTGVGKTTLGVQFMKEAARRGERSAIYTFEEDEATLKARCKGLNIPIQEMLDAGTLTIFQIEPLRYTPDEFAHMLRHEVEDNDAKIIMIDSISGYRLSVEGDDLIKQLHIQTKYLRMKGVTVLLINEVHRLGDSLRATELEISYLMDSIIFLRYIEINSTLRRVIGVLKKRVSDFDKMMHQIEFTSEGIRISKPITRLYGILTGNLRLLDAELPDFGTSDHKMKDD